MNEFIKAVAGILMFAALLLEITKNNFTTHVAQELGCAETAKKSTGSVLNTSLPIALPHDSFCVPWDVNMDEWWTHHPEWYNDVNNDTHTCFTRHNDEESRYYMQIYENQWKNNCSNVYTKYLWCSGWGADFLNIVYGLVNAVDMGRPNVMATFDPAAGWHYAAVKLDGSHATCPKKDLSCYFLPGTNCKPNRNDVDSNYPKVGRREHQLYHSVYNYITRPQQWLRKEVHDFVKGIKLEIQEPCSVMHIRRADVILHGVHSRKYYPVSAYVDKLPEDHRDKDVFLLTDDANAIEEAHEFYPDIRWHYINRTRFRGSEGGWENQTPSRNPKQEVVSILGIFSVVTRCDVLVRGPSAFAREISRIMRTSRDTPVLEVDVSSGLPPAKGNQNSDKDLELHLLRVRMEKARNSHPGEAQKLPGMNATNKGGE